MSRQVLESLYIPEVRINKAGVTVVSHEALGIADAWKTNWLRDYGSKGGVVTKVVDGPNGEKGSLVQKEIWS